MENHDYLQQYQAKSDEELLLIARDREDLIPEARAALESEVSRRGLRIREVVVPEKPPERAKKLPGARKAIQAVQFIAQVTRLYLEHFGLFMKLIGPAVVFGYVAVQIIRRQVSQSLLQSFIAGKISHRAAILQATLVAQATYFLSWMTFCISFAVICSAVARLWEGLNPKALECFDELQQRKWKFFKISMLLYIIVGVGSALSGVIVLLLWKELPGEIMTKSGQFISYALWIAVMLLISRLGLSIPAVILDNQTVRHSIFLSDELTEGRWSILAALVGKAVIGGYIAGMLPFWIASWTGSQVNGWVLNIASMVAVSLIEPIMFIGFSLLYVTECEKAGKREDLAATSPA